MYIQRRRHSPLLLFCSTELVDPHFTQLPASSGVNNTRAEDFAENLPLRHQQLIFLYPYNIRRAALHPKTMAAATTETLENHYLLSTNSKKRKPNLSQMEPESNNNNIEQKLTTSPYDETRVKNDPWFLHRVRQWEKNVGFVTQLRWINIIFISIIHLATLTWCINNIYAGNFPKRQTVVISTIMAYVAGFGVTAGVHRYWTHRSYKAKWPLQLILILCYSVAGQNTIYSWVRDHRVHHKFSETSADPHDARRGFFFSHVGWFLMKKHPAVLREGAKIDMSDIAGDPLIQFHTKYFNLFKIAICFVLPTLVPVYVWDESWNHAIKCVLVRYLISLNYTWTVNSLAHLWGNKPYDRHIMPSENWFVSVLAMGEGWHNYHHTFPWDYKAAELAYFLNITTILLDFFAILGWAYDMKIASPALVQAIVRNRGLREDYSPQTLKRLDNGNCPKQENCCPSRSM